jgi:hypothetical protein
LQTALMQTGSDYSSSLCSDCARVHGPACDFYKRYPHSPAPYPGTALHVLAEAPRAAAVQLRRRPLSFDAARNTP